MREGNAISRTYNQQNSDGSWTQVTQNDNGTYTSVPIAASGYSAANIPTGDSSGGGGSSTNVGADQVAVNATDAATRQAAEKAAEVYQAWQMRTGDDHFAFEKANEAWNESFKQSQANNANALDWMGLASKLSGPANAFNYAKLLTGTPGGLADIVRAAGGAYRLPAFGGGSGGASVPLSIDSIIHDVGAYSPTANGGGALPPVAATGAAGAPAPPAATGVTPTGPAQYSTSNGPKTVAQMASELKVAGWGGNTSDPNAVAAQYGQTTKGAVTPMAAQVDTSGTHTMLPSSTPEPTYGSGYIPAFGALPTSGNQIAPQAWNNFDPGQKDLYGAAFGAGGYNFNDIMSQYQKSLRAYGGPVRGGVGF